MGNRWQKICAQPFNKCTIKMMAKTATKKTTKKQEDIFEFVKDDGGRKVWRQTTSFANKIIANKTARKERKIALLNTLVEAQETSDYSQIPANLYSTTIRGKPVLSVTEIEAVDYLIDDLCCEISQLTVEGT